MQNQPFFYKVVTVIMSFSLALLPTPQWTNFAYASDLSEQSLSQSVAPTIQVSNPQNQPASAALAESAVVPNNSIDDFVQGMSSIRSAKTENPDDDPKDLAELDLEDLPELLNVDPSEDVRVSIQSNDFFYSRSGDWGQSYDDLWGLKRIEADKAWSITTGKNVTTGAGIGIAVIDTGIDYSSPELTIDTAHAWNFINNTNNAKDDNGHGTHVSGIAAAKKDNGVGIAGVCPDCKLLPIKVLDSTGSGTVSAIINGINYVAKHAVKWGIKVINMSLGIPGASLSSTLMSAFANAINYATSQGVTIVAAAGNSNQDVNTLYPASLSNVISVGATDVNNTRASFSNWGSALDLTAPGVDILSLHAAGTSFGAGSIVDPNYVRASGTSMASPFVAGTVALLKARYPALTLNDIYQRLAQSATDLGTAGFDSSYGYGLIDAYRALTINPYTLTSSYSGGATTSTSTSLTQGLAFATALNELSLKNSAEGNAMIVKALAFSESPEAPVRSSASFNSSPAGTWYGVFSLGSYRNSEAWGESGRSRSKKKSTHRKLYFSPRNF